MSSQNLPILLSLIIVIFSAFIGGLIAKKLRQPMILGYITTGIIVGNIFARFIKHDFIQMLADAGVTLLLFTLGVEFSFKRLKVIFKSVFWVSILQIIVCLGLYLVIIRVYGIPFNTALFFAAAGTLSSTAVIVKILSERGELDTIPGEIATGWSVIQDLMVIPMMLIIPAIVQVTTKSNVNLMASTGIILFSIVKSAIFLTLIFFLGRFAIPKILNSVANLGNRELFVIASIGIVFLASLSTYMIGLSAPLGAFIAGLLISDTSQNHAVFSEIRPLRDVFAVVFFTSLGLMLPLSQLGSSIGLIIFLIAVIFIIKWLVVILLARSSGYHRKTAFLISLYFLPMSEFGFILAQVGLGIGALNTQSYTVLVAVTFVSILLSAPLISQSHQMYYFFNSKFGKKIPKIFDNKLESRNIEGYPIKDHVVICGYGRVGKYIGRAFEMAGIPFLVVDYNQSSISKLKDKGIIAIYGDPADIDVLDYAQVDLARAVIIAIPDRHTQELVISNSFTLNKKIKIFCRTHFEEDQPILKALGVQTIIQPEFEAALSIINRIMGDFGVSTEDISGKISRLKIEHGLG
jgi:monovalent cation:H+ antiporter-2, CPA2 family